MHSSLYLLIACHCLAPPPSLSMLVTTHSSEVCIFFVIFTTLFCLLDSTYKWYHTAFIFLFWLISPSTIPSKSICVCKWQHFILFCGWIAYCCIQWNAIYMEAGGLQSMGSLRVGHDWATSLSLFTFTHWRRKWQLLAWRIPGTGEPGGLPSMGSQSWTWLKWLSSSSSPLFLDFKFNS